MEQNIFRLVLTDEAKSFLAELPKEVSNKIRYNILRVKGGERNKELFKKLGDTDIWEFRTLYNRTAYRLFAFWDKDGETLVIATHGIIKKTQKTPSKEIAKAEAIREHYFEIKKRQDMETIGDMKLYSFEEVLDEQVGVKGTPERDELESKVEEALQAYRIGEAIKKAREEKKLTQAQLGEMIGVQKGQISKIESGRNITFSTIIRVFKAMGINAKLDMGSLGNVALW